MHLKRLEIQGFKSFPNKVALSFGVGMTVVVGPNGSGKSNIADAIRFVLGETSAKTMRGGRMEDVIFSGTAARKSLGYAQVSLIIDNSDKKLHVEYTELCITRRLARVGEGEYSINGTVCRLKDIHALLMDTGLGREGYSIVGQGRIDELLANNAQQRRDVFEEATGIVRFKSRKSEAEGKLSRERANLERVGDIMEEIERRLPALEEEALKAHKYLALKEELRSIVISLFLIDAQSLDSVLDQLLSETEQTRMQLSKDNQRGALLEQEIIRTKQDIESLDNANKTTAGFLADARIAIEQHDYETKLLAEQATQSETELGRLLAEEVAQTKLLEGNAQARSGQAGSITRLCENIDEREGVVAALEAEHENQAGSMAKEEEHLDCLKAEQLEKVREAGILAGKIASTKAISQQLEERRESLQADFKEQTQRFLSGEEALNRHRKQEADAGQAEQSLLKEQKELEIQYRQLGDELQKKREGCAALERSIGEAASRHRVLQELDAGFEGYHRSVRSLLQAKQRGEVQLKGVVGAVGALLRASKGRELAIEVALGGAIHNIITIDDRAAKLAIDFLKKSRAGRATFLPISSVKGGASLPRASLSEPGSIGQASSLVEYEPEYEGIFASLLGRTLVVEDLERAAYIARKYNHNIKIVTLNGELLSVGGAITGGSRNERGAGFLERRRELGELAIKLEKQRSELLELSKKHAEAQVLHENKAACLDAKKNELQQAVFTARMAREEVERGSQANAQLALRLEATKAEMFALDASSEEALLMLREQQAGAEVIAERSVALEAEIAKAAEQLQGWRSLRDARNREISDLRVGLGGLQAKLDAARAEAARLQAEQELAEATLTYIGQQKHEAKARILAKQAAVARLGGERQALLDDREHQLASLAGLEMEGKTKRQSLARLEAASREYSNKIAALDNELVRLAMLQEQAETQRHKLFDDMWYSYNITLQGAKAMPRLEAPPQELRQRERSLKTMAANMGDVNVGAIEEHKNERERLSSITAQREDILEAEANLRQLISELDELMKQQFAEEFSRININFKKVFAKMFNGGTARLSLSGDDMLEAGIEIDAQPPGKTLQSISLLSGGERALTAAALLFAIIELRPSPFVVLDEVEAALDDANVIRFARYLREIEDTQFIVITHRKGTMAAADSLYGVTMEEQGVSKIVSVELEA